LRELGWIEGQNLIAERRWAEGRMERLPALMTEVIGRNVDVIFTGSTPGAIAAKNATSTIPIVAMGMGDPVRSGVVASLARPGGNLTGLSLGWGEGVGGKWLELLQETVPRLSTVAVIANPDNVVEHEMLNDLRTAAATRRLKLRIIAVREVEALEPAMDQAGRQAQALLVFGDALLVAHQRQITAFATQHRLPAMYVLRDFVEAGGLMSYGPDLTVMSRRAAEYVDKILRGTQPGNLPIEQPTQYVLIVNLKAAKAIGLTIPESILLRADEVIR
jgi:putative tryptophan/tyrosine transport system substrate-binding protein